ncbi:flagellar hook protein FlgE [Variovorax terrae]|uniref:Flagellar hook protein FlgE n=1 Tax=Variovorax terrae TaxID=2923278 RepID=A0A9X1VVF8_9BURK|nr:flagellar hook-basal body complex protein [Variovorax terrae]MCJ0764536.1 flagellar hook-basal body complex protein [Variovorax terrae]
MLESIYVGMTGLLGYSKGLRVIANNTANINTPGFKGSSLQFSDLFYSNSGQGGGAGQVGYGLNANGTTLSFRQGELRQTGNDLDMAVDGTGLFILENEKGDVTYTRAGQFQFNTEGMLINKIDHSFVMGRDASGNLVRISLAGLQTNAGSATTTVKFSGNLSSTMAEQTVGGVKVVDALGGEHMLSVKLTDTSATTAGSWQVDLMDGTNVVGTGEIIFQDGRPQSTAAKVQVIYTPAGLSAVPLTLDFSTEVTSYPSANLSTLAMASQNGFGPGGLTKATFDAAGALSLTYSNGQVIKSTRLALARFDSLEAVESVGDNQFGSKDVRAWHIGAAGMGGFGNVRSGMVEISNVDLSQEFSDLVVMQRGYQASSQVISTANDMLQELFAMKSK